MGVVARLLSLLQQLTLLGTSRDAGVFTIGNYWPKMANWIVWCATIVEHVDFRGARTTITQMDLSTCAVSRGDAYLR